MLKELVVEAPSYKTLNSKMEFKIFPKEGVSVGMKGNIRICKDSCIILSLQPFAGIEVARCLIRPDSFFVVSRLHSVYSSESIDKLPYSDLMPYNLIESVLTNRMFIPGETKPDNADLSRFMSYKGKDGHYFSLTKDSFNLSFHIDEDQQYNKLRVGTENKLKVVEVNYSMFERASAGIFPRLVEIQTEQGKKTLKMNIFFMEPSFAEKSDFRFPISPKYKKVSMEELMKKFSNML